MRQELLSEVQRIHLRLPSCGPGFLGKLSALCFFYKKIALNDWIVRSSVLLKRTKICNKWLEYAHILSESYVGFL